MPGTTENSECGKGEDEGHEVQILQGLVGTVRTLSFALGEVTAMAAGRRLP